MHTYLLRKRKCCRRRSRSPSFHVLQFEERPRELCECASVCLCFSYSVVFLIRCWAEGESQKAGAKYSRTRVLCCGCLWCGRDVEMTGGKPMPVDASIIAVPAAQIIISTALREFRKACILFKYVSISSCFCAFWIFVVNVRYNAFGVCRWIQKTTNVEELVREAFKLFLNAGYGCLCYVNYFS